MYPDDRRVRVFRIRQHDVFDWLQMAVGHLPDCLALPEAIGVPAGAKVCTVRENFERGTFDFLLWHPSFDPVPEGEIAPDGGPDLLTRWRTVRLERGEPAGDVPVYVIPATA